MEQQKGLTGSTLKIIAMVTMLIDHIGASILERGVMPKVADGSVMDAGVEAMKVYNRWKVVDMACRGIGRIAFPIFCFLLVEGIFFWCRTMTSTSRSLTAAKFILRSDRLKTDLWNSISLRTDRLWLFLRSDRTGSKRRDRLCYHFRSNYFL